MKQLGPEWAGASVSHATLREEDLIPAFERVFKESGNKLPQRSIQVHNFLAAGGRPHLRNGGYESYDMARQEACYYLEDLFDLLNEIAPEGCIFGAHEGDGSDFGFWQVDEQSV